MDKINLDDAIDTKKPPFPMKSAREMTAKPVQTDWLIKGILERGSLNLLFGEPGSGKSLFALDIAFCMAAGIDWDGHKTKQGDVVIVAGEGHAGLARRSKALELKYNKLSPEGLFITEIPAQLNDYINAKWLADSIMEISPNSSLVIIDTFHRNFVGDENSSEDIGLFISNLDQYLKPLGCAILVVHHSGHNDKTRARGSSAIKAAMDGEFSASKADGAIILSCTKSKDFEAFQPLKFDLKPIEIIDWPDDEGNPQTSVYLEYIGEAKPTKKTKLTDNEIATLNELSRIEIDCRVTEIPEDIKKKYPELFTGGELEPVVVHVDDWRDAVYPVLVVSGDTQAKEQQNKEKTFQRSRKKLKQMKIVGHHDDYWWRNPQWSN